jgi:hypothetical protein
MKSSTFAMSAGFRGFPDSLVVGKDHVTLTVRAMLLLTPLVVMGCYFLSYIQTKI